MARQQHTQRNRRLGPEGKATSHRVYWVVGAIGGVVVAIILMVPHLVPDAARVTQNGTNDTRLSTSGRLMEAPVDSADSQLQNQGTLPVNTGPAWDQVDNPASDGWETEVFHNQAKKQLAAIGKLLTEPDAIDATPAANLVTEDFTCGALRPDNLATVFKDQALKVERGASSLGPPGPKLKQSVDSQPKYSGHNGFVAAVRDAASPFRSAQDVRFKFKVFFVQPAPQEVSTAQYFEISGRTRTGMLEQHATWEIRWSSDEGGAPPRIRSIQVKDFEQVTSSQRTGGLFADCTLSVLGKDPSYQSQFLKGYNHWSERIQEPRYFALLGTPGIAVGDANGDGLDDLYVCQEAGLPNRLFIQMTDGHVRDESESRGVNWLESSRGAIFADLDNDSDQDLVVAILGGVAVAENDGQGQFQLRDVLPTMDDTMSLSVVDYDQDGWLDLYVCVYYPTTEHAESAAMPGASPDSIVLHDSNEGGKNTVFRNEISASDGWRFTDVTNDVGLDVNNRRWSFAAAWEDFDNDGDQDLYVANDYGRDNLYRNDATVSGTARFVDISAAADIETAGLGMSITWGDFDRDGWMDAYVSNMFSAAGNRIAFQPKFDPDESQETKRRYQRIARGNTLLKNLGNPGAPGFVDLSGPSGTEMGRWSWGSQFLDFNNDGWEDLFVSNGYITTEDTGDL